LPPEEIPKKNLEVKSWGDAYLLMVAASQHKTEKSLQESLIGQLTDQTSCELKETSRLIIWERVSSGEILFEGKGLQVSDDLFTVGGRANWLLRNLTSKNFAFVKPKSSKTELMSLKQAWEQWLAGKEVAPYKPPFEVKPGLDEIKSLEALEALIDSLKPSEAKDVLTKTALKRLYKLDELPEDPESPANLCNPDTYARQYLTTLTDIKEKHDHKWWSDWWAANKKQLRWNSDLDRFEIKPE
jgi:hypothetical protein